MNADACASMPRPLCRPTPLPLQVWGRNLLALTFGIVALHDFRCLPIMPRVNFESPSGDGQEVLWWPYRSSALPRCNACVGKWYACPFSIPSLQCLHRLSGGRLHAKSLALGYEVTSRWVRAVVMSVASACLRFQLLVLGALVAVALGGRPLFVVSRLKFDGTGGQIAVKRQGLAGGQSRGVWRVVVLRMVICVGWESHDTVLEIPIVFAPLLVLGTSAGALWAAIFHRPCDAAIVRARLKLFELARFSAEVVETDAAHSNERRYAHLLTQLKAPILPMWLPCGCHQVNIVEVFPTGVQGISMLSRLFSLSMFLRFNMHFHRIVRAIKPVVHEHLVIRRRSEHGDPPELVVAYAAEVVDYVRRHHKRTVHAKNQPHHWLGSLPDSDSESENTHSPAQQRFLTSLAQLPKLLNGKWWLLDGLIHYCGGPSCCKSRAHCEEKIEEVLKSVVIRRAPGVPSANKWSKVGEALDIVLLSLWIHGLLLLLFTRGLGALDYTCNPGSTGDGEIDVDMAREQSFRAVLGKRQVAAKELLRNPMMRLIMQMVAIVMEATRHLSGWFMRLAKETDDVGKLPGVFDMISPERSPVTASLQYYGSMIAGKTARLILFWAAAGFSSIDAWFEACPDQVRTLRRLLLAAASQVYHRLSRYMKWPLLLLMLVDPRSMRLPSDLLQEFHNLRPCCLPAGLARRLRELGFGASLVLSVAEKKFLRALARLITMVVADVEWRHARNRARSHKNGQTAWGIFAATSINGEARVLHEARRAWAQLRKEAKPNPKPMFSQLSVQNDGQSQQREYYRAQTAEQLFRADSIARDKAAGKKFNPISKDYWGEIQTEFGLLPDDQQAALQARADMSKDLARIGRERRRQRQLELKERMQHRELQDMGQEQQQQQHGPGVAGHGPGVQVPVLADCIAGNDNAGGGAIVASHSPMAELSWVPLHLSVKVETGTPDIKTDFESVAENTDVLAHPLAEELLSKHVFDPQGKRQSMTNVVSSFSATTQKLALHNAFPKRVTYPTQCPAYCLELSEATDVRVCRAIERTMTELASEVGGGSAVPGKDLVMVVAVYEDEDGCPEKCLFAHMCCAGSRSGHHPAWQVFAMLDQVVVEDVPSDLAGIRLQYRLQPAVPQLKRWASPLNQQSTGALTLMTADEFSLHVINSLGDALVSKVVSRVLTFRDITLQEIETTGVQFDIARKVVCRSHHVGDARARAKAKPKPKACGRSDFLSMMEAQPKSPKQVLRNGFLDSTESLPMPSQRAEQVSIDENMIAALAEELGLPLGSAQLGTDAAETLLAAGVDLADVDDLLEVLGENVEPADLESDVEGDEAVAGEADDEGEDRAAEPGDVVAALEPLPGLFVALAGVRLGKIRHIGGHSVKADCVLHPQCACWLSCKTCLAKGEYDCKAWLAQGVSMTAAQHAFAAYNLKVSHGMKPRVVAAPS